MEYLTTKEASDYLKISQITLRAARMKKRSRKKNKIQGITYVKLGRKVLYRMTDLDSWINKHIVKP